MKYKYKLFYSFSFVIIIPVLISIILITKYLKQSINHELDFRLKETIIGIDEYFTSLRETMLKKINAISLENELETCIKTSDRTPLINKLTKTIKVTDFTVLEVGDSAGKVIVRGHNPGVWGENKKHYKIINDAIAGKSSVDFESGRSGFAIRAVRPVFSNNTIIGTLMAGYSLDAEMAQKYRRLTGLEIGFYLEKNIFYSTIPELKKINPEYIRNPVIKDHIITTILIGDKKYRIALKGLYQNDGSLFGMILVGIDMYEYSHFYFQMLKILSGNILIGLLLSIIICILLSRSFSKPLESLQKYMTIIGRDNFDIRIPLDRKDEFGTLQQKFNTMTKHLEILTLELKRTQTELIRKEKLALAGNLITELAHEIRNPLNSMAANIELLKKDISTADKEEGLRHLIIVNEEIQRLNLKITESLKSIAPINANPVNENILTTLKKALTFTEKERTSKKIVLKFQSENEKIIIPHDKELFYRTFLNILKNSYESMANGGTLTIDIKQYDSDIEIVFKDTGKGMSPEEQKRIFEPYFTTKEEGTGIGLAYVLKVVEAHNGKIKVESWLEKGTEIIITLFTNAGILSGNK